VNTAVDAGELGVGPLAWTQRCCGGGGGCQAGSSSSRVTASSQCGAAAGTGRRIRPDRGLDRRPARHLPGNPGAPSRSGPDRPGRHPRRRWGLPGGCGCAPRSSSAVRSGRFVPNRLSGAGPGHRPARYLMDGPCRCSGQGLGRRWRTGPKPGMVHHARGQAIAPNPNPTPARASERDPRCHDIGVVVLCHKFSRFSLGR